LTGEHVERLLGTCVRNYVLHKWPIYNTTDGEHCGTWLGVSGPKTIEEYPLFRVLVKYIFVRCVGAQFIVGFSQNVYTFLVNK